MLCPRCGADLEHDSRQSVETDTCPECRGVWLDRGELEKIQREESGLALGGVMNITVRRDKSMPEALTVLARRRLVFALGRFGPRVRSLAVRLKDVNGPKGGVDKVCLIAVRLTEPRSEIVVEDGDADAAVAIDRAVDRAGRAVARAVCAARDWRGAGAAGRKQR